MKLTQFIKVKATRILFKSGFLFAVHQLFSKYLTVLNYHRVAPSGSNDNLFFGPNISATPDLFSLQMDLISRWFNVISLDELIASIKSKHPLPPHAALITFDDGYLDNYQNAFPILSQNKFQSLIFLTTNHIGSSIPFYWDLVAYCFKKTQENHAMLPLLGPHQWENSNQRDRLIHRMVEVMKRIPEEQKQGILHELPDVLNVEVNLEDFKKLMMDWDQVRYLSKNGVDFGGHTLSHPILSRVNEEKARQEISDCKAKIEDEIRIPIQSFAYPNGQKLDFTLDTQKYVAEAGYQVAFSLISGPQSYRNVSRDPFAIKRIFISSKDTVSRFAVKISGMGIWGGL